MFFDLATTKLVHCFLPGSVDFGEPSFQFRCCLCWLLESFSLFFPLFIFLFLLCASQIFVGEEVGCNWFRLDIDIFPLPKKLITMWCLYILGPDYTCPT